VLTLIADPHLARNLQTMSTPSCDLVVFGATSFVGRILCRYLLEEFGTSGKLKWAAAGRSKARLEELREWLGAKAATLPLVVADAADEASLRKPCASTRVVASTVGPYALKELVAQLGHKDSSTVATEALLSSGVMLISKPSNLNVPPWQIVTDMLGGVPLRTATFWNAPKIPTTTEASTVECWETSLGKPGPVEISFTGEWEGKTIELASGGNHAKLGVSLDGERPLVIFGDENQQGSLSGQCDRSQNGRGGLFFVLTDKVLAEGLGALLKGHAATANQIESGE
jgi:hypothetical protein